VERDHDRTAEGAASFHTTRWTIVMKAAASQAQGGEFAPAELCRLYWYPLYTFARRRGHSPDDAKDLTQGFFLHVLGHRALTGVDRLKGKFRLFLLTSFQNHLSDQHEGSRRLKRGGDKEFVRLDGEEARGALPTPPIEFLTAEKIFDARLAMTVLGEALPLYDEVVTRLQVTVGGVKTLIHRLRKRYTALLREEVGRTVSDPAEIDEEIHALCEALIASKGRLGP
jgi:DNA-directed RNA polymerase specialized sigma24 family protein